MFVDAILKAKIKRILVDKIQTKVRTADLSKKSGNPFVDIIFGDLSNLKSFIHGTATTLGSAYEVIAREIAKSNPKFSDAEKKVFSGRISSEEKSVIRDIVKNLEEDKNGSEYAAEIRSIYNASSKNLKKTRITIDLYLKDKGGKEYYVEMKGPDPNKKEVRAAKEDLLNIVAIKKRTVKFKEFQKKVAILFGVYYSSMEGRYNNWKVSPIFEVGNGILIQEKFWDFLGGENTYSELLGIIEEVRDEVVPEIKEKLKPLIDNL